MLSQATRVSLSYAPGRSTCVLPTGPASWHNGSFGASQPTRSVSITGRTALPGPVPATTTVPAPAVDSLSYSELAVALHAAGASRGHLAASVEQLRDLADRGAALLGLAEIQRRDVQSRGFHGRSAAAVRQIWGSVRAKQVAHDLAFTLLVARDRQSWQVAA